MIKRTIKKVLRILLALLSCMALFVVPVSANDSLIITEDDYVIDYTPSLFGDLSNSEFLETGVAFKHHASMNEFLFLGQYNGNGLYSATGRFSFMEQCRLKSDIDTGTYDIVVKVLFRSDNGDFELINNSAFLSAWDTNSNTVVSNIPSVATRYKDDYIYLTFKDVEFKTDVNMLRVVFDVNLLAQQYITTYPEIWTLEKQDTTSGLLNGIIEFVKGIYNGIVDLPNKIASSISGFFTWIVDAIDTMKNFIGGLLQSVIDGLIALGNFILDGLKSLFIPSDGFFTSLFNDLYTFFDEKLGVLFLPFELLGMVLEQFLAISEGSGVFTIPDVHVMDYKIISSTTFDLKGAFTRILGDYYPIYYAFVDVGFILIFINSVKDKFDQITSGGNTKWY